MGTKPKRKPKSKAGPAPKPNPVGRPVDYQPEFAVQAQQLCALGATEYDLAQFFKVTTVTIWRWKAAYEEFCNSVKVGKDKSDERVKMSLYHRAVGYTFNSEKVFQFQGEIIRADTVEHVPPDPGAAMNWLKNRCRDEWADKPEGGIHLHLSLADLVNLSYKPDLPTLPAPKVIENEE